MPENNNKWSKTRIKFALNVQRIKKLRTILLEVLALLAFTVAAGMLALPAGFVMAGLALLILAWRLER